MEDTLRTELVTALRSGEYEQGSGNLRTADNKFCCLGVLCDLLVKRGEGQWLEPEGDGYGYRFLSPSDHYAESSYLPPTLSHVLPRVSSYYSDRTLDQYRLAEANDQGKTFAEIADIIESGQLPEEFLS